VENEPVNPLTLTGAIWIQILWSILWQTGLSRHLIFLTSMHSTLRAQHQSAWMSKITNDGLTQSGTRCFTTVPYGNSGHL